MQYIYLLFMLPLVNICLRPVQCLLPWSSFSEPCNSNAKSHIKCDTLWQSKSHSNSKFQIQIRSRAKELQYFDRANKAANAAR